MSTSPSLPLTVACPKCGERLGVRAADVGKRGQCRQCGEVFRIGGDPAERPPAPKRVDPLAISPKASPPPPKPTTVTFPCELCQTRLTARIADVGKSVKCPDCGRRNEIPPPEAVVAPKTPAAMSGEQFDLWGVDDAPSADDLRARTPALHPVACGLCQTLMYATDAQVGKKLKCPDCGTLTVAQRRAAVKPVGPVIVPDGDEYQLDEASAPTPRPVYTPVELRGVRREPEGELSDEPPSPRRKDRNPDGGSGDPDARDQRAVRPRLGEGGPTERPKMPRVPLVQGFWRMLFTSEVLVRWATLAFALMGAGWFLSWVASAMSGAVFMAIPMFAIGCVFLGLWMLTALPLSLAIVTESSEGNDRLHDPPNWMSMEFGEAFFVVIAAAASAFPGWLTLKAAGTLPEIAQETIATGTWLFVFPIVLLSNLEQSSAFAVLSPRLVSSLVRCPGPWILFYLLSAMVAAAAFAAIEGIIHGPPWLGYLGPWVTVTTMLIYMRLIGRLAWWLAETMPASEPAD